MAAAAAIWPTPKSGSPTWPRVAGGGRAQSPKDRAGQRKGRKEAYRAFNVGALKEQSENTAGENARQAERKRAQALAAAAAARERIEILQIALRQAPGDACRPKDELKVERATVGYDVGAAGRATSRSRSPGRSGSPRRTVRLGEDDAAGASTGAGAMVRGGAGETDFALLDQGRGRDTSRRTASETICGALSRGSDENAFRADLARLMFRTEAGPQGSWKLRGGQLLRAGLACVLGDRPPLLILDEPNNHLDIDSMKSVEAGLRAMTVRCWW